MAVSGLAVAEAAGVGLARGVDAAERIDDIVRRVEPIARLRRIENRIHRLTMRLGVQEARGQAVRASATRGALAFWRDRLAWWAEQVRA